MAPEVLLRDRATDRADTYRGVTHERPSLALGVLLTLVLLTPTTSGQPLSSAPTFRVHFIDVGQGAATLVEFPCANVLIDIGGEENGDFNNTVALMAYLDTFFGQDAGFTHPDTLAHRPHAWRV